uniref:Gypsy retrotransposon integrase-like protein 1 n=1 Tax=Leptobrachium leishanense TaxID=445787 RepID=A0A8C5PL16_9ANUR
MGHFFSRFWFHVTYRPGQTNGKADALSCLFSTERSINETQHTILQEKHFLLATCSPLMTSIKDHTPISCPGVSSDGLLWQHGKIYVPKKAHCEVLAICHDSRMAGHGGIKRTLTLTSQYFTWPSMRKDIKHYVRACPVCSASKVSTQKAAGLLQPLPIPEQPWSHVSVDFIVDLPPSKHHTAIMVVVDRFTKMAHFLPLRKVPTAKETANLFYKEIFRLHGIPSSIVSDRGTQFTSRFWTAFCHTLHITPKLSSAYHPQSNGQTERVNQTMEQY